ncbi:MAG: hypothetical protein RLZ33_1753 [Bacteroidota bacterium]|jgi:hypothetical protein
MKKIISVIALLTICLSGFSQFFDKENTLYNWGIPSPLFNELANRSSENTKPQTFYATGIYENIGLELITLVGFNEVDSKEADIKIKKTIYADSIVLSGNDVKSKDPIFIYSYVKKASEYVIHTIIVNDRYGYLFGQGFHLSENSSNYYQLESLEVVSFTFYLNGQPTNFMYCDLKNSNGNALVVFDSATSSTGAKFGVFNPTTREFLFPMEYQRIKVLKNQNSSYFVVRKNDKYALFDIAGTPLTSFVFENSITQILDNKYIEIQGSDNTCLLNFQGDTLFSVDSEIYGYCTLLKSRYGFYIIKNSIGSHSGFVTPSGEVIKCYKEYTVESCLKVFDERFDKDGIQVFEEEEVGNYNETRCLVTKEGKIIRDYYIEYDGYCSEGLCQVIDKETKKKHGFVNNKGEIVIPLIYEDADGFIDGEARVRLNGESFYINKLGNKVPK